MKVAFFTDNKSAIDFEAKCYFQALSEDQECDKWADIIEDKSLGFGVPVKSRLERAFNATEKSAVVDWTPDVSTVR